MTYIVISCQQPIRKLCIVQHFISSIGVFPLRGHRLIINNITVMEQILNIHAGTICQQPVVNIQLVLIFPHNHVIVCSIFIVILGITFHRKGKVILITRRIPCIRSGDLWIDWRACCCAGRILGWCISFPVLHHHFHFIITEMVRQRYCTFQQNTAIGLCAPFAVQLVPALRCHIPDI